MTEYKYLLCGYNYTITHDTEHFVDVKLIGIYDSHEKAYEFQKKLGIVKVKDNCIKGDKYCTWIKKVSLLDGTLNKSLTLRNTN